MYKYNCLTINLKYKMMTPYLELLLFRSFLYKDYLSFLPKREK